MHIHITNDNFTYDSTTKIIQFQNTYYDIYYDRRTQKLYVIRQDIIGQPLAAYENYISYIPFIENEEWEPWAFQKYTQIDIDWDWFRTFLFDLVKFEEYLITYIDTLP